MANKQYMLVKAECRACGTKYDYVGGVQPYGDEYAAEYGAGGEIIPLQGDACPKCDTLKEPDILQTIKITEADALARLKKN